MAVPAYGARHARTHPDARPTAWSRRAGYPAPMSRARLVTTRQPRRPRAAVIVLHGGGGRRRQMMVRPTQLSVLRMVPVAWRIAWRGRGRVAVFRLLNSS